MPCPVGLRKEQMDYRARTDPPTATSLRSLLSPFPLLRLAFLSSRMFYAFFARARFSGTGELLRGFLFGVDGAKSSSN